MIKITIQVLTPCETDYITILSCNDVFTLYRIGCAYENLINNKIKVTDSEGNKKLESERVEFNENLNEKFEYFTQNHGLKIQFLKEEKEGVE